MFVHIIDNINQRIDKFPEIFYYAESFLVGMKRGYVVILTI